MVIYELPISLYSFKLRLAMALKGASPARCTPPGGSYKSSEFKAINPAGTIPTLIDGDFVLSESDAIVEYLDEMRIGTVLLPENAKERARTRMLSRWCDMRLEPHIRALFPQLKAAERNADLIAASDERIAAALALFEQTLDGKPFACGDKAGLVDCGLTACLVWLAAITPVLALTAKPGAKLTGIAEAMQRDAATAAEITRYQELVSGWVAAP